MNKTTDLEIIRKQPYHFTWGKVRLIHDVGRYTIVEYKHEDGDVNFAVYVDGKDRSISTKTLEGALIVGMSEANKDKLGGQACTYMAQGACKLLGIEDC